MHALIDAKVSIRVVEINIGDGVPQQSFGTLESIF